MSGAGAHGRLIRIGTRRSALALAQARQAAEALASAGIAHELVLIETEGDRRAPDTAWGEGAFVKSIEQALLDDRVDLAVHSAKDVPTDEDARLAICAYLPRAEAHDVLVLAGGDQADAAGKPVSHDGRPAHLDSLPAGSVIGTDSPRRSGFLRWLRPDVVVRPLHGNVDTRLRRLDAGEADALVLAAAGLLRLGRDERIAQRLTVHELPPAPGQGAICLQARREDLELLELARALDHAPTRRAVEAEREFLRASGGGCRAPIGAYAELADGRLRLLGGYTVADGRLAVIDEIEGNALDGLSLARALAERLSAERERLLSGPRVLLTRPARESRRLSALLAEHGLRGLIVPAIEVRPVELDEAARRTVRRLADYERVVVTSANGARALLQAAAGESVDPAHVRWAAVGDATARVLRLAGAADVWQPGAGGLQAAAATSEAIAGALPLGGGEILLARGELADERLPRALSARGAPVGELVCYRTLEAPAKSRRLLLDVLAGGRPDAVLFASPSAVRGLLALAGETHRAGVLAMPAVCIGPTSAAAAREAGFTILGRAATQDAAELAQLTVQLLDAHHATGASV